MTSIDEAIARAREKADKNSACWKHCTDIKDCKTCEKEHEQFAEWLEELKELKKSAPNRMLYMMGYKAGYNKAIDDCKELTFREVVYYDSLNDRTEFRELAERLKAGETE